MSETITIPALSGYKTLQPTVGSSSVSFNFSLQPTVVEFSTYSIYGHFMNLAQDPVTGDGVPWASPNDIRIHVTSTGISAKGYAMSGYSTILSITPPLTAQYGTTFKVLLRSGCEVHEDARYYQNSITRIGDDPNDVWIYEVGIISADVTWYDTWD